MKMLDYLLAPVALVGLVATGWWGLYQSPQRPANLAAQLEQDANAALARNGYDWAHVRMNGQRAVLKGAAPSEDAAMAAAETVLRSQWGGGVVVGGVTVVEVAVDPGLPVSPFVWRAQKSADGHIILSGYVPSRMIASQIEAEAARLSGGLAAENRMEVAAGAPGGNWQGVARFGLGILSDLDQGEVRLTGRTLRVSGTETDPAERTRLSAQVSALAAPYRGVPLIKGLPVWTAAHTDEGLVLEGKVRSEAQRRALADAAQAHAAGDVIDRMELAPDMPDGWVVLAETGLPVFARFQTGDMGYYPAEGDAGFVIEGEAPASLIQSVKQDLTAAGSGLPATVWAYPVDVDVPEVSGVDFTKDGAAACQSAFDAVLASNPIGFDEDGTTLSRQSWPALDKLLAVSHRCAPGLLFEIGGHSDSTGNSDAEGASGKARAEAVVSYMVAAGFDPARLSALGYGPDQPARANDNSDGPVPGRLIEIRVLTRSD
ncbi:OmpA family protein [uncultured Hyphomonas sp.]|uniref:OmpA family protein n=1 Tax=uncultured Hyphomonas sp. TaxID=225298 RepID=UPI002AABBD56|nr:OmpA family protein [uncultured Hyphomonas sp.]